MEAKNKAFCCGNLEKMNIGWMKLEDGSLCMPYIESKESEVIKLRVNNCPSCGKYVRDIIIESESTKTQNK